MALKRAFFLWLFFFVAACCLRHYRIEAPACLVFFFFFRLAFAAVIRRVVWVCAKRWAGRIVVDAGPKIHLVSGQNVADRGKLRVRIDAVTGGFIYKNVGAYSYRTILHCKL